MATIIPSSSNNAFELLEQAKRDFWTSNSHLGEDERRQLWSQATAFNNNHAIDTQPSMVHQIPRTMPYSMSSLTHFPVWDPSLVHALSF
jgi:hypothetical protein